MIVCDGLWWSVMLLWYHCDITEIFFCYIFCYSLWCFYDITMMSLWYILVVVYDGPHPPIPCIHFFFFFTLNSRMNAPIPPHRPLGYARLSVIFAAIVIEFLAYLIISRPNYNLNGLSITRLRRPWGDQIPRWPARYTQQEIDLSYMRIILFYHKYMNNILLLSSCLL